MDNIGSLCFRKMGHFGESLEQLSTLDKLRDYVIVFLILQQIDDSYDVGV
jgi:hypothetical protein